MLDEAVNATVATELGQPVSDSAKEHIAPQRHRNVAGLRVVINAARDATVNVVAAGLFTRLQRFQKDSKSLRARLIKAKVTPIAVLPFAAWERLCDKSGLFRFQPDDQGRVRISTRVTTEAKAQAIKYSPWHLNPGWAWLVPPLAIALAIYLYSSGIVTDGAALFLLALFGTVVLTAVAGVALDVKREGARKNLEINLIRSKVNASEQEGSLPDLLWPNLKEPPETKENKATIAISLPEPPEDIQKILVTAEKAGFDLQLAVVGDAITIRENVTDILLNEQRRQEAEERQRAQEARDPIVYIIEGSAVAVIAQYGDFPIEKEVIQEVVNSLYIA